MKIFVTCWIPPLDISSSGTSLAAEIFRSEARVFLEINVLLEGGRPVRGGHQVGGGGDEDAAEGQQGEDPGADSGQQDQLQVPRSPHGERDGDLQE